METWVDQTAVFGIHLTAEQQQQFTSYLALLLAWNQRLNLTAVRDPQGIQQRHFLDSLTCATVTGDLNHRRLIDVGTGAGFPGLPLKILYPELHLTLVDSVIKKTTFLEVVVKELGLTKVQIVAERSEVLGQQATHRERYDWAVARGVAELRVLVEYLLPLCKMGGHMLAQKGGNVQMEMDTAVSAIHTVGGSPPRCHSIQLPELPQTHYLVTIEKTRPTPDQYPRQVGLPKKRPL